MKSQPTEWEKISANHISDKGLTSKICKNSTQRPKNKKQPNQQMGRKCGKTLFQREIQETNRQIKRF